MRRDSFVRLLRARQEAEGTGGGGGAKDGIGGEKDSPDTKRKHSVRDVFGRFVPSPPDKGARDQKKKQRQAPPPPPPPPVTTSRGRVVRRRLDIATGAGGGSADIAAAAAAAESTADADRTGSHLTSSQPSLYTDPLSYADHPRLISADPAPQIGPGWTLVVVGRPGYDDPDRDAKKRRGGRFDRYYFAPGGRRFRNMAEVNKYRHDMAVEHGVVVADNVPRPQRASSRVQRLQEEAKVEEERRAKEEERLELEAEAAAVYGYDEEYEEEEDGYDEKKPASAADGCATCQHFPFCSQVSPTSTSSAGKKKKATASSSPFLSDDSVIWVPTTRAQWDDCVDEMTSVCYSAVLRKHQQEQLRLEREEGGGSAGGVSGASASGTGAKADGKGKPKGKGKAKAPLKPLSRDYIRDRIDIDDPMRGYQIRHKTGGWLQGFVLATTFTTWTHYFKWDSTHPTAGIRGSAIAKAAASAGMVGMDFDGALSSQLEDHIAELQNC